MAPTSTPTPTSTAKTAAPATSAMAAMAAAVFSTPASPIAKPQASQQHQRKGFPRRASAFNDAALLRIFAEKDPLNAPHGTKGAVWDDVGVTLAREPGEERVWSGPACRTRVYSLLEGYDVHRAGKKTPQMIRQLNQSALQVLERTLNQVAKSRVTRGPQDGEEAAETKSSRTTVVVQAVKPTAVAASSSTVNAHADTAETAVPTKATVVAKRRRRKGVKTKEQKRATAAMFEAMRHSREAYLNQLRVETAAQAAAKEQGESPVKTPGTTSAKAKHTPDVDLSVLRAVVKFSPFDAVEPTAVKLQWQAVADQVMRHCGLKFTPTAIRDRCDALLEDFQLNEHKGSTYLSGVAVADEERLKLLRMLHKAHKKRRRLSMDKPVVSGVQSSAIEIDDESNTPEEQETASIQDEEEEEEEREQEQEQIIDETEEDEEDEFKGMEMPVVSRKRPRQESHSVGGGGASPDADPAVEMELELENHDSQESTESHDYTPRKHKQHRPASQLIEQAASTDSGSGQLSAVLEAMTAERHERRFEFRAMLDLMKTQINDNRSKWEREYAQRTREQDARQQESSAMMELLNREREDRKREVTALMTTISKERDDRRNEFMVMMNLITKMIDSKPAQATDATAK